LTNDMKRFVVILISVAVLLAAVVMAVLLCGRWQTYENARYSFSVSFPSGWRLGDAETNGAGRTLTDPKTGVECYAYGFANALQGESGEPQTLDEFVDWMVGNVGQIDGEYGMKVVERYAVDLDGRRAERLVTEDDQGYRESVYALGRQTGIGLFCSYSSLEERDRYSSTFSAMMDRISLGSSLDGESADYGTEDCANLLAGAVEPLRDWQAISDSGYLEAATTSRDDWDRGRLPERVSVLEAQGYLCYPSPLKFDYGDGTAQPEVTELDWRCELSYSSWRYVSVDNAAEKDDLTAQGYDCMAERCLSSGEFDISVWLCAK
ncbi:MAG: hypothetical protein ABIJ46_03505, partial [bacterium]